MENRLWERKKKMRTGSLSPHLSALAAAEHKGCTHGKHSTSEKTPSRFLDAWNSMKTTHKLLKNKKKERKQKINKIMRSHSKKKTAEATSEQKPSHLST